MANFTDNKSDATKFSQVNAGQYVELEANSNTPDESAKNFVYTDGTDLKFWNGSDISNVHRDGNGLLYKNTTETVAATNVITAAESGKVFFLSSATEFASTLPAPAAGLAYTFIVTAAPSGANYTIATNAGANIILGAVHESSGGDGDSETSGADTINFVDGTAVVGDQVNLYCDGTNWFARCFCDAAGGITITTAA